MSASPDAGHRLAATLAAGFVAATAMTVSAELQRRLVPEARRPVDYDAGHHVSDAVGTVVRRRPRTTAGRRAYFALAHWGYGSAVALAFDPLRRQAGDGRRAALGFFVGCEAMALVMLPTLGGTPPPSRWSRGALATSVVQHALYTGVLVLTRRALLEAAPARVPPLVVTTPRQRP